MDLLGVIQGGEKSGSAGCSSQLVVEAEIKALEEGKLVDVMTEESLGVFVPVAVLIPTNCNDSTEDGKLEKLMKESAMKLGEKVSDMIKD